MRLPRSWYPLCLSSRVRRGGVVEIVACGNRVAVFRGADGDVGVLGARCQHAGADLTRGTVVGNTLRCALHGRVFAADGRRLDGADHAPGCTQPALTVRERCGIIFAFHGGTPGFPLPLPDGDILHTHPEITSAGVAAELIAANAFDTAHLGPVHGRRLAQPAEVTAADPWSMRIALRASVQGSSWRDRVLRAIGLDEVEIEIECLGGNLLLFHHRRVGTTTVLALLPESPERTLVFALSLRPRPTAVLRRARERLRLSMQHRAILAFARQDLRALRGARSGPMDLDPLTDAALVTWYAHYHALPRCAAG